MNIVNALIRNEIETKNKVYLTCDVSTQIIVNNSIRNETEINFNSLIFIIIFIKDDFKALK